MHPHRRAWTMFGKCKKPEKLPVHAQTPGCLGDVLDILSAGCADCPIIYIEYPDLHDLPGMAQRCPVGYW